MLRVMTGVVVIMTLTVFGSCNSVIYDEEGDCNYYVHFKYNYNMKWADAFSHEVSKVTLYLMDMEGRIVWSKSESGAALAQEGYAMKVDVAPGQYDLLAWCGDDELSTFYIPEGETKTDLTATLQREYEADGSAHVRGEVGRLYHGRLDNQVFGHENYHFTVPLEKSTNNIRIVLQQLSGELVPDTMFTYAITDKNGALDWDNTVLDDEELIYHAWHVGSGVAVVPPPTELGTRSMLTQDTYSTAIAEFTVSRLMATHAPEARLIIRNVQTGEVTVNINLIDALLLVKGEYNRNLTDQQFLDRQDEYSMTFFLDKDYRWSSARVFIISWYKTIQNVSL